MPKATASAGWLASWLVITGAWLLPPAALADQARDPVRREARRPRGLQRDVRYVAVRPGPVDEWLLSASLGYAWSRQGRPRVDPNRLAIATDLRRRFVQAPMYVSAELAYFAGEGRQGDQAPRSRLRLGMGGGVYGQLGDFELQLGATIGPLLELSSKSSRSGATSAETRFYFAPSARLLRGVTDHFLLGADVGYLVVTKEVDALWLKLVATLRWW